MDFNEDTEAESLLTGTADFDGDEEVSEAEGTGERPEWLPVQFETPEALADAYKALRTKMDSGDTDEGGSGDDESTEAEASDGDPFEAYTKELADSGELSDESYQALEKKGFGRELVDRYIAGQAALASQRDSSLITALGGDPDLAPTILEWGKANLSPAEIEVHDKAMNGTEGEQIAALELLRARYDRANGSLGKQFGKQRTSTPSTGGMTFKTQSDITEAMADPRYQTSAKYRAQVQEAARQAIAS